MPRGSPRLTQHAKKNQIGSRVRERRLALQLTQDALCARLATATYDLMDAPWIADDQEVSKIENGNRTTTDLEILACARPGMQRLLATAGTGSASERNER